MGWEVSQKDGKYRIWSTISDAWITDWISRKEAIRFYYDDAFMSFKKKIVEQFYKFPHMWSDYDSNSCNYIDDEEGYTRWKEWMALLNATTEPEEYVKLIDEIFDKISKGLNAEVEE